MNIDYKIASNMLANRMKTVLPTIIHQDQVGYLKGRQITDAVRAIADTIHYTDIKNNPGLLLFLDFRKAFDTINFEYILKCLKHFNFGSSFIKWVQVLYNCAESCVINGGISSAYFKIERGVRQGDLLSPYLFTLGIELLASAIRENEQINGISILDKIVKIVLYADDITIAVSIKKSAKIALKIIRNFKIISGLELNTEKTHGMWLGSLKNSKKQPFGIDWKKDPIKALSVYFSHNKAKSMTANFDEKIEKLKSKLDIWSSRDMTIFGRACIVNTIGLSPFLYLATVIDFPEEKIKTINQLVSKFIWRGRKPKVKKKTLINDISEGGISLIDLNSKVRALQASWVGKYNLDPGGDCLWKHIWRHYPRPKGNDLLFYCNYDSDIVRSMVGLPDYYKKVFAVWSEISNRSVLGNVQEIKDQLIWNNRYVKVDKK